jgi:hypothetical protein
MSFTRALFAIVFTLTCTLVPQVSLAQVASTTNATTTPATITDISDVETAVRSYFADIPVMIPIARCESTFTQFNSSGNTLNGGSGGMMGVYQINRSVHTKFALSLGYDITTLLGNLQYARYLYNNEGTGPWTSSKSCWGKEVASLVSSAVASLTPAVAEASTTKEPAAVQPSVQKVAAPTMLSINLKVGAVSPQVVLLQQGLNAAGFLVAKDGAGSPGKETTKFGVQTMLAVQRFQCAQNIACKGTEATTGYGFVGAKTRAALSRALAMAE